MWLGEGSRPAVEMMYGTVVQLLDDAGRELRTWATWSSSTPDGGCSASTSS